MVFVFGSTAQSTASKIDVTNVDEFNDEFNIARVDKSSNLTAEEEKKLKNTIDTIKKNNEDPESTVTLALNDMGDMPDAEFKAEKGGVKSKTAEVRAKGAFLPPESVRNNPVNREIMAAFHKKLEAKYPAGKIPEEYDARGKSLIAYCLCQKHILINI